MFTIENDALKVSVLSKGAELSSIVSKQTGLEYLWSGDPRFWSKKSPVLFPIVGTLKNNAYHFQEQTYHLPRHGFARERDFICSSQEVSSITMSLLSDEDTLKVYPFKFRLDLIYTLQQNTLEVKYRVSNTADNEMYFSIGAHPAFKLPLEAKLDYDDYYLEFNGTENALRWLISAEGLIEPMPVPYLKNENRLPLSKELFMRDAIVFKHLNSDTVSIRTDKSPHGVDFHFPRFPFFAVWAFPNADFVCLEPWCGIADSTTHDQHLEKKEGMNFLAAGQTFERCWTAKFY